PSATSALPSNPTHTTPRSTLSLHDALPIFPTLELERCRQPVSSSSGSSPWHRTIPARRADAPLRRHGACRPESCAAEIVLCQGEDRKSTRLNSSHEWISYAVFCL